MYDIIYEFINEKLFGTTVDLAHVPEILTITAIVLIFIFLVKVIVWVVNYFSWRV